MFYWLLRIHVAAFPLNARLLQVAEIFLQGVVCLTSTSLLFSFNLHTVKRKYRFPRHDLLLRKGYLNLLQLLSLLSADHVANPCFLTSGYSDTDKYTCAVHHANAILTFTIRGAQWLCTESTQCSHSWCDPQTYCLWNISCDFQSSCPTPWGVLAVTPRGLPLAFQQIAVIHGGVTIQRSGTSQGLNVCGPGLCFHFPLFSSHSEETASLLFKISPSRSGSSAAKVAHKLVLKAWYVWYLFGSESKPLILVIPFYLLYLDHQRIAVWFQHSSKPDSWLLNWAAVLHSAFLYLPQVNRINSMFKQSIFVLTSKSWQLGYPPSSEHFLLPRHCQGTGDSVNLPGMFCSRSADWSWYVMVRLILPGHKKWMSRISFLGW